MPERELERVMRDFVAQRFNLLLCSTIIETGIDVPTANTIVISRADKFGLAQLHQLRGRVGRSHHQAYAYLLVPDIEGLTKQAAQRLDAIQQMEELGSGFYLAMHDLEIRGAGEVLGENQSGNMMEIGFQLYNEMLAEAVRSLKAGKEPDLLARCRPPPTSTCTPPPCCPTTTAATCTCACLLQEAGHGQEQRADRHPAGRNRRPLRQAAAAGADPDRRAPPARAQPALRRGQGRRRAGRDQHHFKPKPPIDPMAIIQLIQKNRAHQAGRQRQAAHRARLPEPRERVQLVRDVLRSLGQPVTAPQAAAEPTAV
jgi:transcription-repair coupling factor (superfamily II helicase)